MKKNYIRITHEYLKKVGFREADAEAIAPELMALTLSLRNRFQTVSENALPIKLNDTVSDNQDACVVRIDGEGDARFASIEKYSNRHKGEDAISFYQRAWANAPQPFYREDVIYHDPDLIVAIGHRVSNKNRYQAEAGRLSIEDILPPQKPLPESIAKKREQNRKRQATYRERHLRQP